MMANGNFEIQYLNDQLMEFLTEREERIQKELPNFNVKTLVGTNIDIFHKNPAHNRAMLDALEEPMTAKIKITGYHFELYRMPIRNRGGKKLG